jgi:hypothetical protein
MNTDDMKPKKQITELLLPESERIAREMIDAYRNQAVKIGEDLKRTILRQTTIAISPITNSLIEALKKQGEALGKQLKPSVESLALQAAQSTSLSILAEITNPLIKISKMVRERRDYVHKELEVRLKNENDDYYRMWDGSWKAIDSDNPDKIRQSSVSMRELFHRILRTLAKDEDVRKKLIVEKGAKILYKDRLQYLFSATQKDEIDLITDLINYILEIHQQMNIAVHAKEDEGNFRKLLYLYESYIWLILNPKELPYYY